jgi:hypothetical protein
MIKKRNQSKNTKRKTSNAQLKKIKKEINILILGPGYPPNELKKRIEIRKKLRKQGFKAHVMEEKPQPERQITRVDKFDELLEMKNLLCVAISTPKGYSNGLSFEIGYICGYFGRTQKGRKRLQNELGFIISKKADREKILTSYITTGLFRDGISMQYEYNNTNDIIDYINTMIKIRAKNLGLF